MISRFRNPSVMRHGFANVPQADIKRSSFRRSHGHKTTLDKAGLLYPVYVDEALPGDTYNLSVAAVARLATPIKPIMDNLFMDFHFFAVPNRLLWDNWEKFMGEQENPGDSTDFLTPTIFSPSGVGWAQGSLYDYFGVPVDVGDLEMSAFYPRAYHLIWNEWFRDQNLQNSAYFFTGDTDGPLNYELQKRGKRHDYFTSCLPWPQKQIDVSVNMGYPTIPVHGIGKEGASYNEVDKNVREAGDLTGTVYAKSSKFNSPTAGQEWFGEEDPNNPGFPYARLADDPGNVTVNALREAFQLQRMLERDARGGTRYTEILQSHFRVMSPDSRLQRPEYLGGGSVPITFSPIPQTSQLIEDAGPQTNTPQGNLAATAYVQAAGIGFTKSFVEHSVIIGLCSIRADLTYQRGLNRMFSRRSKYDYYWPALAHLGEQAVLNKEIFAQGTAEDDQVFGYQERWAEYRYHPSLITGKMRSSVPDSLDVWHLSQDFQSLPSLNSDFIEETPPIDRIVAVPTEPHFIFDGYFNVITTRPMPMYSIPGMVDHF